VAGKRLHGLAVDSESLTARLLCDRSRKGLGINTFSSETGKFTKRARDIRPM
jgi:hypothetical protein